MWSKIISRGKVLRLTDLEGGANVGMLLYNALERHERYNMPDTLKGQQVFYLTKGNCLHSDMGRLLSSVIADTCGWHDTVCGASNAKLVEYKYGECSYQNAKNDFHRNGHDCFMIELAKWGLGEKDLVPNLNLFSKVVSGEDGELSYVEGNSEAGSYIDLRMEMDCLVVLNLCQHPLSSAPHYTEKPVLVEVYEAGASGDDDHCRLSHPENARAFENTEEYHLLRF